MGQLLAEFRKARNLSQLELGLQAQVSARHISFIETGRSQPSRDLLLRLSQVLNLAHRDTNLLLTASGYAPVFSELPLDDSHMQPVTRALTLMLDKHNPYPAVVMDNLWNLRMANDTMARLMAALLSPERLQQPLNMLDLVFDPRGLRPHIINWETVAGFLLRRLHLETRANHRPELKKRLQALLAMAPPEHWQTPEITHREGPTLTADMDIAGQTLRLFSVLSSFGTALDAGLQELIIESYFPANDTSRQFLENFAPPSAPV